MKVFSLYFKLMKKYLISIILYGLLFALLMFITVFNIIRKDEDKFGVEKVPILLANNDEDNEFIDSFKAYLENYVEFKNIKNDEEAVKDALFYHEVQYILTIPEGFTNSFLKGETVNLIKEALPDRQDSAHSVDTAVNNYLNMADIYVKYNTDADIKDLADFMSKYSLQDTEVIIDSKKKNILDSAEFNMYYFNYLGYIMINCFILGISTVMMSFHNIDIRRRQFASPISSRSFNMQLILANLIFVMAYMLVFGIIGYLFNPFRRMDMGLVLTWINAFLFTLTVLCISYLIGITVKTRNAIQALATILSLSMSFICGIFLPQEYLGEAVKRVSSFTPTFWYVRANNLIYGLTNYTMKSIHPVIQCMAIQIGFSAVFLSVILVAAKRKRQMAS